MATLRSALAAAALAAGCVSRAEGRFAPPVAGETWIGTRPAGPGLPVKGGWTLLVFFPLNAEACAPVGPNAGELAAMFGPKGLVTVGVTNVDRERTGAFLREQGWTFPVLAEAQDVVSAWGIHVLDAPHTYLVDPAGVVLTQDDLPAAQGVLEQHLGR